MPSPNQTLEASPERVDLWFTERIDHGLTTVQVLNAAGEAISVGDIESEDDPYHAWFTLPENLPPGIYTVVYDNLSRDDGHRWQGFFPFIVLNPDGSQPAATALPTDLVAQGRTSQLPNVLDVALRWLSLVAAVAVFGAAVAHLAVVRPATDYLERTDAGKVEDRSSGLLFRLGGYGAAILVVSATGQALLLVDRLGGLSRLETVLLETRPGTLWVLRILLGLAIAVVAITAHRFTVRWQAVAAPASIAVFAALILAAYSVGSHAAASMSGGEAAAIAADFIHFLATGLWLGVLLHISLAWRAVRSGLASQERLILLASGLDRFSALAVISVMSLMATGLFSALVQISELSALWDTTYGRVLLLKLALVVPLLAVAAINALYLKPALVGAIDGEADAGIDGARLDTLRQSLSRSVAAELVLGVFVLGSVALLTQTGTARGELALASAQDRAALAVASREHETYTFNANKLAGDLAVAFRVDPQLVGINKFEVRLNSAENRDIGEIEQVSLRFFYNDPAFGSTTDIPIELDEVSPLGELVYQHEGAYFSIGGAYRVQVDVKRAGQDDVRAIFPLEVEQTPEPKRPYFDFPFYIGSGKTTAAVVLLVSAVALFGTRGLLGSLEPRAYGVAGVLAVVLFGGAAAMTFSAVAYPPHEAGRNPVALTADSVERGRILFARNCAVCHGDTGRGDGPGGVNLIPPPADFLVHIPFHSDATIYGWIRDGMQGSGMPAFGDALSDQERWDLVNFLRQTFTEEDALRIDDPFNLQDADTTPVPTVSPTPTPESAP